MILLIKGNKRRRLTRLDLDQVYSISIWEACILRRESTLSLNSCNANAQAVHTFRLLLAIVSPTFVYGNLTGFTYTKMTAYGENRRISCLAPP